MRVIIQRVSYASVAIDGVEKGKIGQGFLILFGAGEGDTREETELLAKKTAGMRIFCDEGGKMNLSLADIGGSVGNFSVHALRGLPQGKPPQLYRSSTAGHCE